MKTLRFIFAIALTVFTITGCQDNDEEVITPKEKTENSEPPMETQSHPAKAIDLTESQQNITKSLQEFSWDIFKTISNQEHNSSNPQNAIFSPLSFEINLTMLLNGAEGTTLQEILAAMRLVGHDANELNQYFQVLSDGIDEADNVTQFHTANSLWHDKRYSVETTFEQALNDYYDCEFFPVVYGDETTARINKWAEERTYGRIDKIIDKTTHNSDFYHLINAVYFRSPWSDEMHECGKMTFTQIDNTIKQVEMFKGLLKDGYYSSTTQYTATMLPFSNSAFGMFFILPNEGISFNEIYTEIQSTGETFANMPTRSKVTVTIPMFEVRYDTDIADVLCAIGGNNIFASPTDLNILNDLQSAFPKMKQIASIKVNEKGAEAAAVSAGWSTSSGEEFQPIFLTFDRPFIYGIVERSTGMPLFIGEIIKL